MGFQELPNAIDAGQAYQPITEDQVRTADETWSDEVALGIVLSDTASSLAYLQSKGLVPVGIETAEDVVRGVRQPRLWPDGKPRANLSMHVVLQAIEKILPALYMSLFANGRKEPFLCEPKGRTSPDAARANAVLLGWAMKKAKTKEEMRLCLKTALTHGFTVGSWGWESREQKKKVYAKYVNPDGKTEMRGEWKTVPINLPMFTCEDLKMVLVDPSLKRQDIQNGAKFVVKQIMTDGYGLDDLRDNDSYFNIPTNDELASFLTNKTEPTEDSLGSSKRAVYREFQAKLESEMSSKDPMTQPLELLEYTTKDRVVTVLQRKLVIRNEANEFGKLNFQSCAFIDILGSAWGFGVARLLAGEQNLQAGVANNWIDSFALTMNPVFQLLKGIGPGTQNIPMSPGKVITEAGELKPLITGDLTAPAMEAIAASDARANEKVGANGGMNTPNAAMRTAQGVQAFAGDVVQKLQYFLEQFIDLIYIPTLEAFLNLMHEHLTIEQINAILTDELGKAYEGDISDIYNAECAVDVLAGANMMAKFAAAQLAPQLISLLSAGPVSDQFDVQGKYFDYESFIEDIGDLMGYDMDEYIKTMTPEMLQRVQQKNAALMKAQAASGLQQQKHQDTLEEIDAKAAGQGDVAVVRGVVKDHQTAALNALEQQANPEAQNGQ